MQKTSKQRTYLKNWKKKNRARVAEHNKTYRDKNSAKCKAARDSWRKEWRKTPAGIYSTKASSHSLCSAAVQFVFERNIKKHGRLTCYLCLIPLDFGRAQIEHSIPLSRGGANKVENLDIACGSCNQSKHSKTAEEFLQGVKK